MKEHIFLGAYWSARKESRSECAQRLVKLFDSIANTPSLGHWYQKSRSRKAAQVALHISEEEISRQFKTNNREDNGKPITELGFSLGVWNGSDENPISFSITCGSFSKFVGNSAVLSFPEQEPPSDEQSVSFWKFLLERFIESWDPEDATVTSNEYLSRVGGGMPAEKGGWLTYKRGKGIEIQNA